MLKKILKNSEEQLCLRGGIMKTKEKENYRQLMSDYNNRLMSKKELFSSLFLVENLPIVKEIHLLYETNVKAILRNGNLIP